uniref:Ig-like domain-containing protein n=1 Tax=Lates calcarifer TaxID=8187 RepID=A0A4W6G3E5_LATCA
SDRPLCYFQGRYWLLVVKEAVTDIWGRYSFAVKVKFYKVNKTKLNLHRNVRLRVVQHFFRGRTSLFKDQISRGNASLQLTGVEVQDQGRYKCHTSTNRGISKVNMEQVGNRIICSSEGIYPEPDLTWSTSPLSNLTLQNQTSIQQTEQQLYNISSSLILSDSETDLIYICTISTRSNSRNTTFFIPNQLRLQDQRFRNRTSLFKDQISRGNASLQLTGVEVQDQGGYRCYTSTMRGKEESFINLRVDGMRDTQEIHKDICLCLLCTGQL